MTDNNRFQRRLTGVLVTCLALLTPLLAGGLFWALAVNREQAQDIQSFKDSAKAACHRSIVFGPALAVAYERYHILTPQQIRAYRASIPESCP